MFTHFFKFYNSCKGASSLSEREDKAQNETTAQNFLTINTQNPHNKQFSKQGHIIRSQYSRSMVEMLGVLAIVGVLSVGGIAGYSKAMMKYKLNKHAESFNILLNDTLRYSSELIKTQEDWTLYNELFLKLGLIPDGFKYVNKDYIQDNFKNQFQIYAAGISQEYKGGINIKLNSIQKEVCYNFIQTAKENSANLWLLKSGTSPNESNSIWTYQGEIFGDNYCASGRKCLKNLSLDDFTPLCDTDTVDHLLIMW